MKSAKCYVSLGVRRNAKLQDSVDRAIYHLNYIKCDTLNEIKTSLEIDWQRMIQLSYFFLNGSVCLEPAGYAVGRVVKLYVNTRWISLSAKGAWVSCSCVHGYQHYWKQVVNFQYHRLNTGSIGSNPDSKVHGARMGPIWGRQDPGGPKRCNN